MKLAQLIVQYVAFRKSLGQDFESNRKRLRAFSRFVGESVATDSVKPSQVAAFLAGRDTSYWHLKYGTLRGFFNYAITRGYLSTSPLPATVPKPPARFVPPSTSGRSCAASSTARRPIRNIRRES